MWCPEMVTPLVPASLWKPGEVLITFDNLLSDDTLLVEVCVSCLQQQV